jgi:EAL domain-containing protein (putative c-di-GMP-specific phosphodiesterase class I)
MEVTENVLIEDIDKVIETLNTLRALGIRIELDDFGTGYSSMSYLERLPVDTLKIDRSFVSTIDSEGRGGVIAKLVLEMARSLDMSVVAEGMETHAQLDFMRKHDCEVGQGFLFCKPLPAAFLTTFFSRWNLLHRKAMFPDTAGETDAVKQIVET